LLRSLRSNAALGICQKVHHTELPPRELLNVSDYERHNPVSEKSNRLFESARLEWAEAAVSFGLVLDKRAVYGDDVSYYGKCYTALKKGNHPDESLANEMWEPDLIELRNFTYAEKLLIARVRFIVSIVKLTAKGKRATSNRAINGNCIALMKTIPEVAFSLGDLSILPDLLSVVFVHTAPRDEDLRQHFEVRTEVIKAALAILMAVHLMYKDQPGLVTTAADHLPEHGCPEEVVDAALQVEPTDSSGDEPNK